MCGIFEQTRTFPQEKGPDVDLVVDGDEYYANHETADGYSTVYDRQAGLYCYAAMQDGQFISTSVSIAEKAPDYLTRHLRESNDVVEEKFGDRFHDFGPGAEPFEPGLETFGGNAGLLLGRTLHTGNVTGLTVLVNFKDLKTNITAPQVEEMLNGDDYTKNGNFSSVNTYFDIISSGKLNYTNRVVGPITLSKNRSHYVENSMVEEAVNLVVAEGVDLKEFDSLGEGIVDSLILLYAGPSIFEGDIWPHNGVRQLFFPQVRTHFYLLTGLGMEEEDLSIGTICHEAGHLLCRFPDMYDYGTRDFDFVKSQGIGKYCLMGSGNHLDRGHTPSPVCAYLRELAGWTDKVINLNKPGTYAALHGAYDTVMKYKTAKANEYFLVENRSKIDLDGFLPSSGLAIYHCDTLGSNEWQNGTEDRHYQCALEQADGKRDLELGRNRGDGRDLFGRVQGVAFSRLTSPSSKSWDGSDSGFELSDIGAPGSEITFTTGGGDERHPQVIHKQAEPNLNIPDYDPGGVHSVLTVSENGLVGKMWLKLNISHTWIGDLKVVLESPTGRQVTLHSRQGVSEDNIVSKVDTESALAPLIGESVTGPWILRISDHAHRDQGTLNSWSFEIVTG